MKKACLKWYDTGMIQAIYFSLYIWNTIFENLHCALPLVKFMRRVINFLKALQPEELSVF